MKRLTFWLQLLVAFGLVITPLVWWGGLRSEVYKVWATWLWIDLVVVLTWWRSLKTGWQPLNLRLVGPLAIWLIIVVLSAGLGVDLQHSLTGNFYRADGLVTLAHLVALAVVVSQLPKKFWNEWLPLILATSVGLASLVAVASGLVFSLSALATWPSGGWGGSFHQPNYLAGFLLVTLPASLWVYDQYGRDRWKNYALAALLVQLIAMVATGSVTALVGLGLLAWLWWGRRWLNPAKVAVVAVIVAGGLIAASLVLSPQISDIDNRWQLTSSLVSQTLTRPWLGVGWANVSELTGQLPNYVDKAHGEFLEFLVTTGVVGFVAYLVVVITIISILWHSFKTYSSKKERELTWLWLSIILVYLFHAQTNITSVGEWIVFWSIVGLLLRKTEIF